METVVGMGLLLGITIGGVYLYIKVERLDREIARQRDNARRKAADVDG